MKKMGSVFSFAFGITLALLYSSVSSASDCSVFIISLGGPYPGKVIRALESRGYSVARSIQDADYTLSKFGATRGLIWEVVAVLEDTFTGEKFQGEGRSIFVNRAFAKGIAKLPLCPPEKK